MEINDLLKQILHNQLIIMSYLETDNNAKCNQLRQNNKTITSSLVASNEECELAKRLDMSNALKNSIISTKCIEKNICEILNGNIL